MLLIFVIIGLCGLVQIVTSSYLLMPLRERIPTATLRYLFSCNQCIGFWTGVFFAIYSYCLPEITPTPLCSDMVAGTLLMGGVVSLFAVIFGHLIEVLHFAKLYTVVKMDTEIMINKDKQAERIAAGLEP